jgi:hypothetical protein
MDAAAGVFIERPGRSKSLAEWRAALAADGAAIDVARGQRRRTPCRPARCCATSPASSGGDSAGCRFCWARRPPSDEYDDYRPGTQSDGGGAARVLPADAGGRRSSLVDQLAGGAASADGATVAAQRLRRAERARGWLRYLDIPTPIWRARSFGKCGA